MLPRTAFANAAVEAGKHKVSDGISQNPMRLGQRIVKAGALFKFCFVQCFSSHNGAGCLAAAATQGINFKSQSGSSANRQHDMTLGHSHADKMAAPRSPRHFQRADSFIRVCPTSTPYQQLTQRASHSYSFPAKKRARIFGQVWTRSGACRRIASGQRWLGYFQARRSG